MYRTDVVNTATYIEVVVPRDALHLDDGGDEHQRRHEEGACKSGGGCHGHATRPDG